MKKKDKSGKPPNQLSIQKAAPDSQNPAELSRYIERLNKARDERNIPRKEFDGMYFEQDFERNREASFSYLRPKINDDDVRVNTGTAEKKVELMLNEIMAMNFQPEIRAYDKNDIELLEVGADFTDLVRKTNTQEKDEDTWMELVMDLLTQRASILVEEVSEVYDKRSFGGYAALRARKRRMSPLQVYFPDQYIPLTRLDEQPYIVIYDRMLYSEAEALYGNFKDFKYVVAGMNLHDEYIPWFKYRFSTLRSDEVEVITYMSSAEHGDEFQVILNGVMMFKPNTPMPVRSGYGMAATAGKLISDFVYGKPPLASAKYLQALSDENIRNLVFKFRQAIKPPLGVPNGKVYGSDVFAPGSQTQGLVRDNFSKLVDHDGVTPSEFQMFQLITQKTEEFIGAAMIQNQPGVGNMTATQVLELQKQALKMLGQAVFALRRLKRDATYLRINSILTEYSKPLTETVKGGKVERTFRTFEVADGRTSNGDMVHKFIMLTDRVLTPDELKAVRAEEKRESEKRKKEVRISFVNVELLKKFPILFHVEVNMEQQDSGVLDKAMFQDKLAQAANVAKLTGRQLDQGKPIEDFEETWKARGWFGKQAPQPMPGMPGQAQGMQPLPGSEPELPRSPAAESLSALSSLVAQPK